MSTPLLLTIITLTLIAMIFLLSKMNASKKKGRRKERLLKSLENLKENASSENEFERRDTIIRLDNLLAKALNYRYNNGSSCGENLKKANKLFRKDTYQNLWDVHKLRNDVVHNNRSLSVEESEKAYHVYKMCITKILK
ncbi:MAG: transmembrane(s)protein [candidate division WS6 bacterium 34_10]|uniref:Transmembrane(S)protein n=1 Tax=candidate division WS6 bacterium 34_10 TaxID=1641389 RepID=A0A101HH92_9BACT|nr:MAG: transmembrane(s)protein [candidate division WS6 bacterium 34_10]